ncbi:MAG TPA: alpha/beta fold hydrolase [Acidimicrobiales bacterium]|jgi:pimeloyl-ACP methyl ester carboxylesterase|nr:alpha/beta fold hydrolase [Acidimicrobiales bacterium]
MAGLDRDGVSIHYEVHGEPTDRAPLLLNHGYSSSTAMWEPNLAALGTHRRVVTWDIRGHGQSDSPGRAELYSEAASVADMVAVLDAGGIDRAVVGGLSLGGYLSLAFYLAHPTRVTGLLLFDTGPGFKKDDARSKWNAYAEATAAGFERDGLTSLSASPEVGTDGHDPAGLALAARGILTQRDARIIESLPAIDVPTLVLVGADDRGFLAAANYMAGKIPGADLVVLPGAGHAANLDQPDAFNQEVSRFLDRGDVR